MKLELNQAYMNQRLIEAEISGRGHYQMILERIWLGFCVMLFIIPVLFTMLLMSFSKQIIYQTAAVNLPVIVHKPIASTIDDGSWVKSDRDVVFGSADKDIQDRPYLSTSNKWREE